MSPPVPHVVRHGAGAEEALFFHCMLSYAQSLEDVAEHLTADVTATLMDLPGHGASPDWDPALDYGDMCLGLALQCLDTPRHVIGHSFGAYVALRLAVEFPHLVQTVTLIDPVFFAVARADSPEVYDDHLERAAPGFEALQSGDLDRAAELFTAEWGDGRDWTSLPPKLREYCASRMPLVAATQDAVLNDKAGLLPRLPDAEMPVLILQGSESPPIIRAICDSLEASLPYALRVTLQGAGHMAPLTNPHEVAGVLGAFIATHAPSRAMN